MSARPATTHEDRADIVRRLLRATVVRAIIGNGTAVAMVAAITGVTARAYFDEATHGELVRISNRIAIPGFVVATIGGWFAARWFIHQRMSWFLELRDATQQEAARFAALPQFVAVAGLVAWAANEAAYLLYFIHVHQVSWPRLALAKELAANLFGYVMATALSYLLIDRLFRPYLRYVLPNDVSKWPRPVGLSARLLAAWFTVAGAPLLLIVITLIGLTDRQRALVAPGLIVTGVLATVLGFVAFLMAGRTITGPLARLQRALRQVATGDLTARVDVDEIGEIGHLEAGFNSMVEGLRTLATDNASLQDELRRQLEAIQASRVRIVEAADAERARIERNLHDGAQQRLLSLSFALRSIERRAKGNPEAEADVHAALVELDHAMAELRELARGIHPAILDEEGLGPALGSLAERSTVPTQVTVHLPARLPSPVEVTAYFVAAEALANVAKYARASDAAIEAVIENGALRLDVRDDGVGGAEPAHGSGLRGLADRVAALGGELTIESERGRGTRILATIPCASS